MRGKTSKGWAPLLPPSPPPPQPRSLLPEPAGLEDLGPVAQKFRKNQTQVKIKRKIKRNLRSIINRVAQNN